ncbi:cytolethal distending toxin subunit B family protein, partial [Glaesserella parasuis]
ESKWNINVRQLLTGPQAAGILMVQEAGSLPSTVVHTRRMVQPEGVGFPIDEYVWNLGTRSRPNNVYIYYSRLDVG